VGAAVLALDPERLLLPPPVGLSKERDVLVGSSHLSSLAAGVPQNRREIVPRSALLPDLVKASSSISWGQSLCGGRPSLIDNAILSHEGYRRYARTGDAGRGSWRKEECVSVLQ
jgi:hypothetical protein